MKLEGLYQPVDVVVSDTVDFVELYNSRLCSEKLVLEYLARDEL